MNEKIRTILMIGLVSLLVISSVSAISIGVVPSRFTIGDAHRGDVYDQKLTIYNTANESCNYEFEGRGEIGDWASFFALDSDTPINMTEIPGKSSKKVNVRFLIPSYVATGNYTGEIYVRTIPENVTGGFAIPILAAKSRGRIMVTEKQTLTGIVTSITALDTEVNNTLRVNVSFQNTGDVIASPAINVSIATNELLVDCFVYDKIGVMPGANETIPVEWNTTGQIPGNYSVNVSVSLGTDVLAAKNLTVRILPPGTLARAGDLIAITTEGELSIGQTLNIVATFENTGAIDTNAKFVAEVYIDGNLTEVVNSTELVIPVGEVSNLTALLDLTTPGDYEIRGHVLYDGNKSTDTKELSFAVTKAESAET